MNCAAQQYSDQMVCHLCDLTWDVNDYQPPCHRHLRGDMTPAELITGYLQLRDKKREMERLHKEALAPFNETLSKIEMALAQAMEETGLDNLPGGGGTAYRSTRTSVTVDNWDAFMMWVMEHGHWHLLERRASKTAVEEVLAETDELPPGISMTREYVVQVRKT